MTDTNHAVFNVVAMDITSFCNLRCPFCISEHDLPKVFMDEDVFDKAISLIPLAKGNNFLFSCLYEPTIHPSFLDYIQRIPDDLRHKVFFTTNLAKRISDEVLDCLSRSGFHHINISLDSLQPDIFESLRKGAKFDVFHDNLTRLVEKFSQVEDAPDLYYVSVVNKLNYKEIPGLVEQCFDRYLAKSHDIREYWLFTHQKELSWCLENKLSPEELAELKLSLDSVPHTFTFCEAGRAKGAAMSNSDLQGIEVTDQKNARANVYHLASMEPEVRIHADGKIELLGKNEYFFIQDIAHPPDFFRNLAELQQHDIAKTLELRKVAGQLIQQTMVVCADDKVTCCIDQVLFEPKELTFKGWAFHGDNKSIGIGLSIPGKERVVVDYEKLASPDVSAIHGASAAHCRFELKAYLDYVYPPEELTGIVLEIFPLDKQGNLDLPNAPVQGKVLRLASKWLHKIAEK